MIVLFSTHQQVTGPLLQPIYKTIRITLQRDHLSIKVLLCITPDKPAIGFVCRVAK